MERDCCGLPTIAAARGQHFIAAAVAAGDDYEDLCLSTTLLLLLLTAGPLASACAGEQCPRRADLLKHGVSQCYGEHGRGLQLPHTALGNGLGAAVPGSHAACSQQQEAGNGCPA